MNCKGNFIFRGIEKKDAGSFTDQLGNNVTYNSSYHVKVDEIVDGKINERKFKFPVDNTKLANDFSNIQPYTPIEISFDLNIFATKIALVPKSVFVVSVDKK